MVLIVRRLVKSRLGLFESNLQLFIALSAAIFSFYLMPVLARPSKKGIYDIFN